MAQTLQGRFGLPQQTKKYDKLKCNKLFVSIFRFSISLLLNIQCVSSDLFYISVFKIQAIKGEV